jgi:hypothetical protein
MELTSAYREGIVLRVECITNNSVREESSIVELQMRGSNATNFPSLRKQGLTDLKKYVGKIMFFNWNKIHVSRYT